MPRRNRDFRESIFARLRLRSVPDSSSRTLLLTPALLQSALSIPSLDIRRDVVSDRFFCVKRPLRHIEGVSAVYKIQIPRRRAERHAKENGVSGHIK